jgi:ribosomal protein S18 acetylase RimI-like enzyme
MSMSDNASLRSVTEADLGFLYEVYASTRQDELQGVAWSAEQKNEFLRFQFEAQHRYYLQQFPSASYSVVVVDGNAAGRLYIDRRNDEIRIIDIALLPEYRRRGIGSSLVAAILDEALPPTRVVRIHVERDNPALRLYERLGFERIEDQGVYWLMEWRQPS